MNHFEVLVFKIGSLSMCDCDYFYDDPGGFCIDTMRKARKPHNCYSCEFPIEKGEVYKYTKQFLDGDWSEFKVCKRCLDLADLIESKTGCRPCSDIEITDNALEQFCTLENKVWCVNSGIVEIRGKTKRGYTILGVAEGEAVEIYKHLKRSEQQYEQIERSRELKSQSIDDRVFELKLELRSKNSNSRLGGPIDA